MRLKTCIGTIGLALLLLTAPLEAAIKRETVIRSAVGFACGTVNDGVIHVLVDASAIDDCDATGGGTKSAMCLCDSAVAVPFGTQAAAAGGASEYKVTNVTVADDGAGTKPAGAIPITTDFATCTCNDATGCTMSIAEPTPTSGYGRSLTIVSAGTGNCEFADSAGVTEIGSAVVLEPTSVLGLVYANAAWHRATTADNVP